MRKDWEAAIPTHHHMITFPCIPEIARARRRDFRVVAVQTSKGGACSACGNRVRALRYRRAKLTVILARVRACKLLPLR